MFPSVLIVDDEPSILQTLGGILSDEGFEITTAENGYEALKRLSEVSPDIVLLDIWMPGLDGLETLDEIRKEHPFVPVILITGHGTIETAVQATKAGAFDFIEKPLSVDKVVVTINNALNFRRLEEENRYLRKKTLEKNSLTGSSQAVNELKAQIAIVAPTDAWILIQGESGTGKELVARTVHQLSGRADRPLVVMNCGAIPPERLDSEWFGHERHAFPGADQRRRGAFEIASGGALFMNEVGDLDLATQGKILSALDSGQFTRLGGERPLTVDVRVIASTCRNLEEEVAKGTFREDLYYKLNVVPIQVPALRDRKEDVPALAEQFFARHARDRGTVSKVLSPEAGVLLSAYPWPGNVRELRNLAERLLISVEGPVVEAFHVPPAYRGGGKKDAGADPYALEDLDEAKKTFERTWLFKRLARHFGDLKKTAKALGMDARTLEKKLRG
ncbi:MAG: sigma-54 dependent transcriptional regulator [Pseudomonadota bacterium]